MVFVSHANHVRCSAEMNRMSLESTVRTQLSVYRKDKTAKDEHIRRL